MPEWIIWLVGVGVLGSGGALLVSGCVLLRRAGCARRRGLVRAGAVSAMLAGLLVWTVGWNFWRLGGERALFGLMTVNVWHAAGFTLSAALLALAGRGLYGEPARGRARCPRCWYDMSGGGSVCPECGRTIANPAALLRRRRRWRLVGVAALGLVVAVPGLLSVPRVKEYGSRGLMPTTVLIAGLPWLPSTLVVSNGPVPGTLRARMAEFDPPMWEWQFRWARARATGLMLRDPRSEAFRRGQAILHCPDVDRARFALLSLGWLTSDDADLRRTAARIDWCWHILVVSPAHSPSAPEVDPFIPALLPRLEDEDANVRRVTAFLMMGRLDRADIVVPALIRAATRRDEGGNVAASALIDYVPVSPEALRWVVTALESGDPSLSLVVARQIGMSPTRSPAARTLAHSPEFRRAVEAYDRNVGSESMVLRSWLRHAIRDGGEDPR